MIKHKAGLHKDVAKIFNGVWIPQEDNIQNFNETISTENVAFIYPKPLTFEQKSQKTKAPKAAKAPKKASRILLSPKARRERKRLNEISRHLLINLDDKPSK